MKINADVIGSNLILEDPRRVGDGNGRWLVLPGHDRMMLKRTTDESGARAACGPDEAWEENAAGVVGDFIWNVHDLRTTGRERRAQALKNLERLKALRNAVDAAVQENVHATRELGGYYDKGISWERIGKALGVTKQAAQARYGKTAPR